MKPAPHFHLDDAPKLSTTVCATCGGEDLQVTLWVLDGEQPHAVVFCSFPHDRDEVLVQALLGGWDGTVQDKPRDEYGVPIERVTFTSHLAHSKGRRNPQASLLPTISTGDPVLGGCLDRQQAAAHPLVDQFWALFDWLYSVEFFHPSPYDPPQHMARCQWCIQPHYVDRHVPVSLDGIGFNPALGAVVQSSVLGGQSPILSVARDVEGNWMLCDGVTDPNENSVVACVNQLTHIDPSLVELLDLNPGVEAWRENANSPWQLEAFSYAS